MKPTLRKFMSHGIHTVGQEQTLELAHGIMREHGVRHLPVLAGGKLVGVVSLRDLHLIETLRDVEPAKTTVEEAMTCDVHVTGPDAPLDEVASTMADHKYGSAIVVERGKVVGVFTTVDALRALATFAAHSYPTPRAVSKLDARTSQAAERSTNERPTLRAARAR